MGFACEERKVDGAQLTCPLLHGSLNPAEPHVDLWYEMPPALVAGPRQMLVGVRVG